MRTKILAATAMSVLFASPAFAQAQGGAPAPAQGGIAEIVVTAQKRAESVQNVPIAISAFTATALKERAVSDVSALSGISPNVTLDASTPFSGSTAVLGASIRGVGSADFAFNIDPAVGVYLDGVYLARSVGANQDLLDVERIEVLKGPQGTLFGRNTIGGAISIVTHEPGKEFKFQGDVTTGSFHRLQARGMIDMPINDQLSSSVTFGIMNRDGYQHRIPFRSATPYVTDGFTSFPAAGYSTGSNTQGGDNSWSLRGKLKWDNGNGLKATFTADYTHVNQDSTPNTVLATTEGVAGPFAGLAANNIPGTALDVTTGSSGWLFAGLYNFCISATPSQIAARNAGNLCGPRSSVNGFGTLGALGGATNRLPYNMSNASTGNIDTTYANGNNFSRLNQWGLSLVLEGDVGIGTLKSISSYRKVDFAAGVDLDGSPLEMLQTSFLVSQYQMSEELQLTGTAMDGRLKYVLGAYGFKEAGDLHDYVTFAEGLLQVDGPGRVKTVNYAGYGQLDFKVSDLLSLTLGGRYTHEDKEYYGFQSDVNGFNYKLFNCMPVSAACASALGFPNPSYSLFDYYPTTPTAQSFNNFSPKAGIQLRPARDVMIYGSWSRGYKTGGWTTRLSNPLPLAPTFGPEHAETWELGIKSTLLNRKLQINAAIFSTKYDGIQLNQQQGVSPTVANLGDASIKGAELEVTAAPGGGFTIQGSIAYLDAHYTYICGQSGLRASCNNNTAFVASNPLQAGIAVGSDLPKAPHWKINVSPRYEVPVGDGKVVFLADWTHTSEMRNDTEGTFLLNRKATDIINASVTWKAPGGRYDITVGGTNLTNERYLVTGQAQVAGGQIYGTYSRPAEWYARIGVKF
ncbi:TonB-dependent receptor [Novosphingobium sp. FSY-8]|uniref:TonB-dependent receptor n=1 Tax=Novosphingobium ovatum TaxID=1908523 RepID=A0ABW9XE28_9SPHN|nr:TonB-dependent receptor [Novosphingobium ovatum]NBC36707.1 TonB-dependent receptor [Novosphingobium ovatum]